MENALEQYINQHIDIEPPLLKELNRQAHVKLLRPRMISGHLQGRLLKMFIRMIRPKKVLELGTFAGYSALCMAEALDPDALIFTIDIDDELETFARSFIERSPDAEKIRLLVGDALELLPQMNETFDLVFIDADKRQYSDYYRMILPMVNSGGIIIADNTLWDGKVIQPIASNDHQTKGIIEFNRLVADDPRVEKVILPVRDGLTILHKL